jgi:fumarate reductase subunit D
MKNDIKEWIIFGSGVLVLIAGIVLAFIGIYIPPAGMIEGSVLTVIAEFLTFAGSAMGIGSYTAIQIHKINKQSEKRTE